MYFLLWLKKRRVDFYFIWTRGVWTFLPHQMLHRRAWRKKMVALKKRKEGRTFPISYIGKPEISRTRDIGTRRTHLTGGESMQSHVCAYCSPRFSPHPSRVSSLAVKLPLPSPRPLVSRSLRYLCCTLCSRTHVVVRMHTRAYIRRVLRKLAPYASIQISHVCTYSVGPASAPVSPPSPYPFLSPTLSSSPI